MPKVTFADVVHQSIAFSTDDPAEALVLKLIDTRWVQRLRDISQTANTRLVYMFSEHSRFGHCLGVAYLAKMLLGSLALTNPAEVDRYKAAVLAAALLHDVGHLAPGSHTAFKAWFPGQPDIHEEIAAKIVMTDPEIHAVLQSHSRDLPDLVCKILDESDSVPAWTWQAISGSGWNVDRGNWCIVDSVLAGVSYGKYNIPALVDSITLSDGRLALRENRLDAMMHFVVSRHAMYRQIYQHRVLLAADMINRAIVQRARDLGDSLDFADEVMWHVLRANSPNELELPFVFEMREEWWRYHLLRWRRGTDSILADLADRLVHRRLYKTVRVRDDSEGNALRERAPAVLRKLGLDPRYYLFEISTVEVHSSDSKESMVVTLESGDFLPLADADPLFKAVSEESPVSQRVWLALPHEAKQSLTIRA